MFQLRLDLLDAQSLLDDATARLQHFADPAAVDDVAARCPHCHLSPYEQRVTIEAAIWATAMRDRSSWTPLASLSMRLETDDTGDPGQLDRLADQAHHFTADTFRIVLLVVGRQRLPAEIAPRAEPPGWRRRAAALIRLVLREHGYDRTRLLSRSPA